MGKRVFLVRHARAVKREEWRGDDCLRPLTEEGKEEFRNFVQKVLFLFPKGVKLISSPCERALKTAEILGELLGREVVVDERLAPDAEPEDYESVVKSYRGSLVLVAHEPDLSLFLNYLTCLSPSSVAFKKGAVAELRKKGGRWKLFNFLIPKSFL